MKIWLERFVASHRSFLLARRLESRAGRGGSQILLCKWKFSGLCTERLDVHTDPQSSDKCQNSHFASRPTINWSNPERVRREFARFCNVELNVFHIDNLEQLYGRKSIDAFFVFGGVVDMVLKNFKLKGDRFWLNANGDEFAPQARQHPYIVATVTFQ